MRSFIALAFVSPELDAYKATLRQLGVNITNHNHLTLQFLGDLSTEQLENVQEKLSTITFPLFTITTTHLDNFSHNNHPNILWLGIDSKELLALQKIIEQTLQPLYTPDKPFKAHLTLARIKTKKWKQPTHQPPTLTLSVKEFILYTSTLNQRGPTYTILKTYPLH